MDNSESRVAVYIDFDNIVISRYNQIHGKGAFQKHKARDAPRDAEASLRLAEATVDIDAVLDFASSIGSIAISRAYADWSAPFNASYQSLLVARAVDLTQMFPTVASNKNGADIRLAVDVVEDLFRLPTLTHVVIVSGDSDFIPLAQRSRRLGRSVVGIGVAGATSASLAAACNEYFDYDALPGIATTTGPGVEDELSDARTSAPSTDSRTKPAPVGSVPTSTSATSPGAPRSKAPANTPKKGPTGLLVRALLLGHAKNDAEWLPASEVKNQMLRMDPTFNEKSLGFASFTSFVRSRSSVVELDESVPARRMKLRPAFLAA